MRDYFIYLLLAYGMFAILFLVNLVVPILHYRRVCRLIANQNPVTRGSQ